MICCFFQDSEDSESDDERDNYSTSRMEDTDGDENVHEQESETVEYFPVVGSNWEMRYQEGLNKCYQIQVRKKKVQLRVEHEPRNISDSNALKFEVYSDGQWFIIGYCGVKKIPKLKRALHRGEVLSLELYNLHRIWYPVISEFRFASGINIVKMGRWDKDDPTNRYNSMIVL